MDSDADGQFKNLFIRLGECLKSHKDYGISVLAECYCEKMLQGIRLSIRSTDHQYLQDMVWNSQACYSSLLSCQHFLYKSTIEDFSYTTLEQPERHSLSQDVASHLMDTGHCSPVLHHTHVTGDDPDDSALNYYSTDALDLLRDGWVMCVANLVAGNKTAIDALCLRMGYSAIATVLLASSCTVSQKWCAVMLNILKQDTHKTAFCRTVPLPRLVSRLCSLYCADGAHASFARYCLEQLLCGDKSEDGLLQCWRLLPPHHRVLCLTAVARAAPHTSLSSPSAAPLLCRVFMEEAGRVLSNDEQQLCDCDPQVLRESCSALLSAASASPCSARFQEHPDLLFITVCFLKALNQATFGPATTSTTESWMRRHLTARTEYTEEGDALHTASAGLRCDLVQLIGNLVHQHRGNQDKLREYGGLEELFCSCRRDDSNPWVQEAVVFALGCGLRDNPANGEHLRQQLEGREDGDCPLLQRLGLAPKQYVQVPTQQ